MNVLDVAIQENEDVIFEVKGMFRAVPLQIVAAFTLVIRGRGFTVTVCVQVVKQLNGWFVTGFNGVEVN